MESLEAILEHKGREVHAIDVDATVIEAVEEMCARKVGALVVMAGDMLVGMFSERDLLTRVILARKDPATTPVGEVMTREVVCIAPELSPGDAMELVTAHRVRHLPVVDGRRIVGVVSIGDLVRWTVDEKDARISQLNDYVCGRYPG